jgi:hypothetical protein
LKLSDHIPVNAVGVEFIRCMEDGVRTNRMREWIDRFVAHSNGILFTSANSYCRWWQALSRQADAVLLIQGYVNAVDGRNINRKSRASFGSCMFAMGERAVAALRLAEENGLGTLHTHTAGAKK